MTDAPFDTPGRKEFGEARERSRHDVETPPVEPIPTSPLIAARRDWLSIATLIAMVVLAVSFYRTIGVAAVAQDGETAAIARADALEAQIDDTAAQQLCRVAFSDEDFRIARIAEATFRRGILSRNDPVKLDQLLMFNTILQHAADKAIAARVAAPQTCKADPGARPEIANLPPIPE